MGRFEEGVVAGVKRSGSKGRMSERARDFLGFNFGSFSLEEVRLVEVIYVPVGRFL